MALALYFMYKIGKNMPIFYPLFFDLLETLFESGLTQGSP